MCPCRWSASVGSSYGIMILSYSATMMIMPITITIMTKIATNGGCLNKKLYCNHDILLDVVLLWSLQLWCFKSDLSISAVCWLNLASDHTCKSPMDWLLWTLTAQTLTQNSLQQQEASPAVIGWCTFFFLTRALTVCHFSFRFRNAGAGALRGVEKKEMLSQKIDFKLL